MKNSNTKKVYVYTVKCYLYFKILFQNISSLVINKFLLVKKDFFKCFHSVFRHGENKRGKTSRTKRKILKRWKSLQIILIKKSSEKEIKTIGRQKETKPEQDVFKAAERFKVQK